MRGVKKAISMVSGSGGGEDGTKTKKGKSGTSAIERISRGRTDVPESIEGYSLETNSPITARWVNEEKGRVLECSRKGSSWQVEVHEGEQIFVVSEHGSFEGALDIAEDIMSGRPVSSAKDGDRDTDTDADEVDAPSEFEQEVEEVLDGIDEDSMESVEEVGEIFGD